MSDLPPDFGRPRRAAPSVALAIASGLLGLAVAVLALYGFSLL